MATRTALSASYADVNNAVNGGGPFTGAAPVGSTVIVPKNVPTGGTWTLGGATGLSFSISASALQTALRAQGGAIANVTVAGDNLQGYSITFPAFGAQTTLTGSAAGITPSGLDVAVGKLKTGSSTVIEVQYAILANDWKSCLVINNGITLQGQTTVGHGFALYGGTSKTFNLTNFNNVTITLDRPALAAGFSSIGGTLDIMPTGTVLGTMSFTGLSGSTLTGCTWLSGSGTFDANTFIGQGYYSDQTIVSVGQVTGVEAFFALKNTSGTSRVTGLTIVRGSADKHNNAYLKCAVTSAGRFRVDHNHIGTRVAQLADNYFADNDYTNIGVIDHNVIEIPAGSIEVHAGNGTWPVSDGSWIQPASAYAFDNTKVYGRGGPNSCFYEDNYFYCNADNATGGNGVWDGTYGTRWVVRYNVMLRCRGGGHGTEGGRFRGARLEEIYNNTIVQTFSNIHISNTRSGTMLLHHNKMYGGTPAFNNNPQTFRESSTDYSSGGWGGGADGMSPWDYNDSSNGNFTNCKRPTPADPSPVTNSYPGTGEGPFSYHPVASANGNSTRYYSGVSSVDEPLTANGFSNGKMQDNSAGWGVNQWVNFGVRRVFNVGSASFTYQGSSININTLTGSQSMTFSSTAGMNSTGGVLTAVIGGADKYIIYTGVGAGTVVSGTKITSGTILTGCSSMDAGTLANGASMTYGDGGYGLVLSNTVNVLTMATYTDAPPSPKWKNGDKYVISRVLIPIDSSCRGTGDLVANDPQVNLTIDPTGKTAAWPRNQLEPDYEWQDTYPATGARLTLSADATPTILEDRDYFSQNNNSWVSGDVTDGVTVDENATAPPTQSGGNYHGVDISGVTTNPPWRAFWAGKAPNPSDSDNPGVLYVLTGPNTWTPWYAPYTYPHPLTGSSPLVVKPVITSALTANSTIGTSFSYTITASNGPTLFNATQMPAGFAVNQGTGVISCTSGANIGQPGVYNILISAGNQAGTDNETLVLTLSGINQVVRGKGRVKRIGALGRRTL